MIRESIVGFRLSIAASSESPSGPKRTTVNSTEICEGVSPEPATVGRRRRESRPITARRRPIEILLGDALRRLWDLLGLG